MKQMPFEPPTNHYDERIEVLDEQICQLIKQRKELSNNNPGFPTQKHIADWSQKYNFYADFLNGIFSSFLHEDLYRPAVEPTGFLKNIPVLKSFEKDGDFYTVTFVRQYENASVVYLHINKNGSEDELDWQRQEHTYFELSIQAEDTHYDCRNEGGGGSMGHESFSFIVSPALPDDLSKYQLIFNEHKSPTNGTGVKFVV